MQLVNGSAADGAREARVSRRLVETIAQEVWLLHGRNGTLNWAAVERHLNRLVERARRGARHPRGGLVRAVAGARPPRRLLVGGANVG